MALVVFLDPIGEASAARVRSLLPEGFAMRAATSRDAEHQKALIAEADFAVSGDIAVGEEVLRAGTRLKLLHKWGVGVDNFALDAARALNIKVARTTGSNAVPVAEFTIGLMLAAQRRIAQGHARLQQGDWIKSVISGQSVMFSGKTVGIVGLGAIGKNVARMLGGFGCRVLYAKPTPIDRAEEERLGVTHMALADMLAEVDILSLNCPLTEATRGLIDRAALTAMRDSAILVNVSRGGVVVEADLIWALRAGQIRGAATDVFEVEPTPPDNPLLHMDNVVVTPHCAAVATDNFPRTVKRMFDNMQRVLRGEPVPALDLVVG
jgi:phosphoglycerate dehydrogenase-like enzyme